MPKKKNKALIILLSLVFVVLSSISYFLLPPFIKNNGQVKVRIGDNEWRAEVANNSASRAKGLSGHDPLGEKEGMLFIFEKSDAYTFWMKGMKFSLDIIWINGGKVVDISENLPPAGLTDLKLYSPREPANWVLEINAGSAKKFGVKIGDSVELLDGDAQILYY